MLCIQITKHHPKAVVVHRGRLERELVIAPVCIAGNQISPVPSAKEIAAPSPNIAFLMQLSIRLDEPLRRAFNGVRVIYNGPIYQACVVKSLVQQDGVGATNKGEHSHCDRNNEKNATAIESDVAGQRAG